MTNYSFVLLTSLGGTNSAAYDINNGGQVAGLSSLAGNPSTHAVLWDYGTIKDLGHLNTHSGSQAYGINDAGQVVGRSLDTTGSMTATLWDQGNIIDLFPGTANAINNSSQVIGFNPSGQGSAVLWHGGTITNLFQSSFLAPDINDSGQVVGASANKAVRWSGGTITNLSVLPQTTSSYAYAINNAGQIAGDSTTATGDRATFWDYGTVLYLGTLGPDSVAMDINESGQIVGSSNAAIGGTPRAALWNHGCGVIDLNKYLPLNISKLGWVLREASAINDNGWIVGIAINAKTNECRGFLMIPHP